MTATSRRRDQQAPQAERPEVGDLLSAMVALVSTWSSLSTQARVAQGVGLDMNESDVRSLHTIGRLGEVRPAELADWLHISRPTASKSLARLGSAGLIRRRPDPSDRRGTTIELSDAGTEAYERLVDAGIEMVRQALDTEPSMYEHADSFMRFARALSTSGVPGKPASNQHATPTSKRASTQNL